MDYREMLGVLVGCMIIIAMAPLVIENTEVYFEGVNSTSLDPINVFSKLWGLLPLIFIGGFIIMILTQICGGESLTTEEIVRMDENIDEYYSDLDEHDLDEKETDKDFCPNCGAVYEGKPNCRYCSYKFNRRNEE